MPASGPSGSGAPAGARGSAVVIGAGISGLSAAWRLAGSGVTVDLLESSGAVGGMAGTVREGPYHLDFGPHSFFSDDPPIFDAVQELFGRRLRPLQRRVKLYYEGRYLDYPLTARGTLLQMGPAAGLKAAAGLLAGRLLARRRVAPAQREETVEDWARRSFGGHLYRTFFKPYTEQFWEIPCAELSAAAIPTHTRLSFTAALRSLLKGRKPAGDGSLIDRELLPTFYPPGDFAEISDRIAQSFLAQGGRLHLECEVTRVGAAAGGGLRVSHRRQGAVREIACDHVVSTVPLPALTAMLEPAVPQEVLAASRRLEYRSLVVLGIVTPRQEILGCAYLYQLGRPYNRVFEMNAFSPQSSPPGENILAVEIPCPPGGETWRASPEQLLARCRGSLEADGLLAPGEVRRLLVARVPCAYPVYRLGYREHLERVLAHLRTVPGLSTLGRSGEFRYMDIDRCIRRAFDLCAALPAPPAPPAPPAGR